MDAAARAQLYADYLTEEGFRPKIDDDGDVVFKYEGKTHFIIVDKEDEEFFQLLYPRFWTINDEDELARARAAADFANKNCKVVKIFLNGEEKVTATIEMLFANPEEFKPVFPRILRALRYGVNQFTEKM